MSNSCFVVVLGVATVLLGASTSSAQPIKLGKVDTGPGTLTAARKYLEGRWGLVSFEVFPPGKPPIRVTGDGMLTYDAFGNLEARIKVPKDSALILEAAGIPTTNGAFSTSGRTAIDLQARTLTYIFSGQPPLGAPSGPLALNRPRHWQVEDNVLTLTTKDKDGTILSVTRWQKAP
jgi:hypothetical protein